MGISETEWLRERGYSGFIDSFTASFEGVAGASASAGSKTPSFTNIQRH